MPPHNPEITDCAERNDREGVLRCLENNQPILLFVTVESENEKLKMGVKLAVVNKKQDG